MHTTNSIRIYFFGGETAQIGDGFRGLEAGEIRFTRGLLLPEQQCVGVSGGQGSGNK